MENVRLENDPQEAREQLLQLARVSLSNFAMRMPGEDARAVVDTAMEEVAASLPDSPLPGLEEYLAGCYRIFWQALNDHRHRKRQLG
jgi:hypothetical protein